MSLKSKKKEESSLGLDKFQIDCAINDVETCAEILDDTLFNLPPVDDKEYIEKSNSIYFLVKILKQRLDNLRSVFNGAEHD